jgi:hypothetical protein
MRILSVLPNVFCYCHLFSHMTKKNRCKIETKLMQKSLWFDGYKQAMTTEKRIREAGLLGDACADAFMRECFECSENQVCFHLFKVLLPHASCQVVDVSSVCNLPLSNIKRSLCLVLLSLLHILSRPNLCVLNSFLGSRFSFSAAALHLVTLATSRSGLRVYQ